MLAKRIAAAEASDACAIFRAASFWTAVFLADVFLADFLTVFLFAAFLALAARGRTACSPAPRYGLGLRIGRLAATAALLAGAGDPHSSSGPPPPAQGESPIYSRSDLSPTA